MKSIDDALELRGRILGAFEQAERSSDPARREKLLTFVVVGAGPTGVEMAGQIAELADHTLKGAFRHIDSTKARVILLDAAPAVLPPMGEKLGKKAQAPAGEDGRRDPAQRDGHRRRPQRHHRQGPRRHHATHRRRPARCGRPACRPARWAGTWPSSPASNSTVPAGSRCCPICRSPGHPNVFVVGDMAAVEGVPGMAQGAIQGGKYAAKAIKAGLKGADPAPARAVQVLRQGLDGHGVAVQRGGQDRQAGVRRLHRVAGLAGAAPGLSGRLQDARSSRCCPGR